MIEEGEWAGRGAESGRGRYPRPGFPNNLWGQAWLRRAGRGIRIEMRMRMRTRMMMRVMMMMRMGMRVRGQGVSGEGRGGEGSRAPGRGPRGRRGADTSPRVGDRCPGGRFRASPPGAGLHRFTFGDHTASHNDHTIIRINRNIFGTLQIGEYEKK